jgi:hypothetical protein
MSMRFRHIFVLLLSEDFTQPLLVVQSIAVVTQCTAGVLQGWRERAIELGRVAHWLCTATDSGITGATVEHTDSWLPARLLNRKLATCQGCDVKILVFEAHIRIERYKSL